MDLTPAAQAIALQQSLAGFIEEFGHLSPPPGGARKRPDARTLAWQRLLVEHGYAGRWVPCQYGGFGQEPDPVAEMIIADAFAEAELNPGIRDVGTSLVIPTLLEMGTPGQKACWIAPTLRQDIVWCQGFSEPEAGSDLTSLRTTATLDGDDYVINGRKIWTTNAQFADMMILLCRTEGVPGRAGLSTLLLPMTAPGITVRPIRTATGTASFNEVTFDDVRLASDQIVGAPGAGWSVAGVTLKYERLLMGASDKATSRLRRLERMIAAKPPSHARDALVDRLMRLQAEALAAKCQTMRATTDDQRGDGTPLNGLLIKALGASLALRVSALAVDVNGVAGLRYEPRVDEEEDDATRWYGDNLYDLGLTIGAGSVQVQKDILAERGLGLPRAVRVAGGR
jgi:alkylation response protein AidB-like acyl-CoA dehydrogenase